MNISNNKLVIFTNSEMYGNAKEELEIDYNSENVEISFNAKYLLEVLNVIDSDKVKISFSDPYSAVSLVDPLDVEDKALFIIMPTRG